MTTSEGEAGPAEGTGAKAAPAPGSALSTQPETSVNADEAAPLSGSIAAPPDAARQLELQIERTRQQLGDTVQELMAKADLKGRALAKATDVSRTCKTTIVQARKSAWEATPEQLRQALAKGAGTARDHWVPLTVASGVVILDCLAVWQWKARPSR